MYMAGDREQGREISLKTEKHQIMKTFVYHAKDSGSHMLKRLCGSNVEKGLERKKARGFGSGPRGK